MKRKLIEVALPLKAMNTESIREKSIRQGHPSTLHLWWARRPLSTCRGILFAQLVDDPSNFPDRFPTEQSVITERHRLFKIIEELVKWENSTNDEIFEKALKEIRSSCPEGLPSVHDPFSGGGTIPLEAQRLGLTARGSDLNPVAVVIGKGMIEIPSLFRNNQPIHPSLKKQSSYRNLEGLAEDVEYYGEWVRENCFNKLRQIYPKVEVPVGIGDDSNKISKNVISWIWARTVPSPDPAFENTHVPLMSSFLLSNKKNKQVLLKPIIDKINQKIEFKIVEDGSKEEIEIAKIGSSAGKRQGFRCLISGDAITYDYIRKMGQLGLMKHKLVAIVAEGNVGRVFLPANQEHINAASVHTPDWVPDLALTGKSEECVKYGITNFSDLFTKRQLVSLNCISQLIKDVHKIAYKDALSAGLSDTEPGLNQNGRGAKGYADAILVYLAFGLSRLADISNAHCNWSRSANQAVHLFGRQAIPMVWDFAETGLFSNKAGDYRTSLKSVIKAIKRFLPRADGIQIQHDAQAVSYAENTVISTDPPYYDNINYADLSDFFYPWLKRTLGNVYPDLFSLLATPKEEELVASIYRHKSKSDAEDHFLMGMKSVIKNMAISPANKYPIALYYAFKQSEVQEEGISSTGWSTFLEAVIGSGYKITGTWPVRTERDTGLKVGMNVLSSSVVIVCRRRSEEADKITRGEFVRLLKNEMPIAIKNLQKSNIAPADMPQSAIGPGMSIFSRYSSILEADDNPMTVKTALQLINNILDEFLNKLQGDFDPETRFAATWFEQSGHNNGEFGIADNLARARGITVDSVKHAGIVKSSAGKVRILKREELDPNWEPNSDTHLTIWECCQYLVRKYEDGGETAAAMLIKKMGYEKAESVKDLAYYLYDICSNKRQDAKEATSYNALIAGWNDIMRMANSIHDTDTTRQASLF